MADNNLLGKTFVADKGTKTTLVGEKFIPDEESPMKAALRGARELPSGLAQLGKNLAANIRAPGQAISRTFSDPRQLTEDVGRLSAAGGGAVTGAAAGAPLAPFTLGLSVPAGALIGGLGGEYLFEKAGQTTGAFPQTTAQQDIARAAHGAGAGAPLAFGGQLLGGSLRQAGRMAKTKAPQLRLRGAGVTRGDIVKGLRKRTDFIDEAADEIATTPGRHAIASGRIQESVKMIEADGFFKRPTAPDKMLSRARARIGSLTAQVDDVVDELNKTAKGADFKIKFKPKFKDAQDFIDDIRTSDSKLATRLQRELDRARSDFEKTGRTFKDLVKAKKSIGKNPSIWSGTVTAEQAPVAVLKRKLFTSFQRTIEESADAIARTKAPHLIGKLKELNTKISSYLDLEEPLRRAVAEQALPKIPSLRQRLTGAVTPEPLRGANILQRVGPGLRRAGTGIRGAGMGAAPIATTGPGRLSRQRDRMLADMLSGQVR